MNTKYVTELVLFKTISTVDEASFYSAVEVSTDLLRTCGGFIARHLTKAAGSGEWIDVVLWSDLASAHSAADRFMTAPEAATFMACIDPSTVQMRHGDPFFSAI
ncbi:MAG: hypothetical protein NTV46_05535 [Verrucomicrobia bacterium]|nr:hypothetical protein [Verrucomicrobiota bacterium]